MSNQNTTAFFQGGTRPGQIATLANIGTTETAFSVLPNPVTLAGGGVAVLTPPDLDQYTAGQVLRVRVAGTVTTNVSTTVAVKLYQGNDSNLSNDHVLVNPTPINVNSATSQFFISAEVQYDSLSQTIHGIGSSIIGGTFAAAAATTPVTSIASASSLQFVISGLFGASNAANALTINQFSVEAV